MHAAGRALVVLAIVAGGFLASRAVLSAEAQGDGEGEVLARGFLRGTVPFLGWDGCLWGEGAWVVHVQAPDGTRSRMAIATDDFRPALSDLQGTNRTVGVYYEVRAEDWCGRGLDSAWLTSFTWSGPRPERE